MIQLSKILKMFTATDLQRRSSAVLDSAATAPVVVSRNSERFVLMSVALYDGLTGQAEKLASAQQRCRELEGDADRLDWCVANKAMAVEWYESGWRVKNVYSVYMTDSHTTARDAIDAAIAAQRQKVGE